MLDLGTTFLAAVEREPDREAVRVGRAHRGPAQAARHQRPHLRRRRRLTVVVISHDFAGLENLCPRTLHLRDGQLATVPTAAGGMA